MARRLLAVALGAGLLAGCRLDLGVHVLVEPDGSGVVEVLVTVDEDGIERIGGDLGDVLVVDDLESAGWTVEGPAVDGGGATEVRFSRGFADADAAEAVFASIAGDSGPFRDFAVERDTSFARTEWRFRGRIDFAGGVAAFSDPALAGLLDGEPIGQSQAEIEAQLGEPLREVIDVEVRVRLPGDDADPTVWQAAFGEGPVDLSATRSERRTTTIVASGGAAAAATALLVYGALRLRRLRTRPDQPPTGV